VNREAILVIGMHRSGTSAVAGLLARLGAVPPRTLMRADAANAEGYWESAVFHEFHERLLGSAGTRWDAFRRCDPEWFQSAAAASLEDECRRLLHAEFGDALRFVLKDPRMCRFVPFWLRVLERESTTPLAVLVHRHPLEVADSLGARDGLERSRSLLIWLRHVLDAEFATRTIRRTWVGYEDLLRDWRPIASRIAADLGGGWPAWSRTDEAEIGRILTSDLRHHHCPQGGVTDVTARLADWVGRASESLGELAQQDPQRVARARASLDTLRQEFDQVTDVFGELEGRMTILESQLLASQRHAAGLEAVRDHLERQVQGLAHHAGALEHQLSAARHDANAVRASMSWRITAPLRAAIRIFR
jgi:hypothetical protein